MKFKIPKGSDVYNSLVKLFDRGEKCSDAASKLAKHFGAENYGKRNSSPQYFGGADAFKFSIGKEPDKNLWRKADKANPRFFIPKAKNKQAWDKIKSLPSVSIDEINNAVSFPKGLHAVTEGNGISIIHTVVLNRGKSYFLLSVHNKIPYKAPKGVVEILESEYTNLLEKIEKE